MTTERNDRRNRRTQVNSDMLQENEYEDEMDENKHAVTLSIYTETTVKTVKLSVQKSTRY